MFMPATKSHSLIVSSKPPEARILPSGLNATEVTKSVCPPPGVALNLGSWAERGDAPASPTTAISSQKIRFIVYPPILNRDFFTHLHDYFLGLSSFLNEREKACSPRASKPFNVSSIH